LSANVPPNPLRLWQSWQLLPHVEQWQYFQYGYANSRFSASHKG